MQKPWIKSKEELPKHCGKYHVGETQLMDVFETMEQREQNGARSSYAESRQSSTEGQYGKGKESED